MEQKQLFSQIWANPWLKKIPVRSLFATVLATAIHPVLAAVGFQLSAASSALASIGFSLGQDLLNQFLPALVEAAKQGIQSLADWLEKAIAEKPEVNQAAAQVSVNQAEPVGQSLQELSPAVKEEIASAVREGMQAYGGATAAIAPQYADALKDLTELRRLVAEMQEKLEVWSKQSIEARRNSLVANAEQSMEGKGEQRIIAEDDSSITGVKQSIKK